MSSLTFEILPEFSKPEFEDFRKARKQPLKWALFDFSWRRSRYGRNIPQKRGRDLFLWNKQGWKSGQAPNLFFDPAFYVTRFSQNEPFGDQTPLEFYLFKGLSGEAPHWLFSEKEYFLFNTDLPKEHFTFDLQKFLRLSAEKEEVFLNGYDHFCLEGDREGKRPHRFFSPALFLQSLKEAFPSLEMPQEMGAWEFFLSQFELDITQLRTSWYFDPKWYLQTYPEVAEKIEKKKFSSPLHHYLTNKTPSQFNPLPYFSEAEYLTHHPDVQGALDGGAFRNAYDHFLSCGMEEGRTFLTDKQGYPRSIFHLIEESPEAFAEMKALKATDRFALYVAYQELGKDLNALPKPSKERKRRPEDSLQDSGQIIRLSQARQEALFSVLSRSPLQIFAEGWEGDLPHEPPYLSVVLFSHGDYAALVSSIESLAPLLKQGTELLVVTSGNMKEAEIVRTLVKGEIRFCHLLKTEEILTFWEKALETIRGQTALWLEAGVRLKSENLKAMLPRLENKEISAFAGVVKEGLHYVLGGCVAMDGTLPFQPLKPEKMDEIFQGETEIDLPAAGMMFFDVSAVKDVWQKIRESQKVKDRIVWTGLSDFESLALSLREYGNKILFSPSFIAHAESKLSFPTRESHLARWRRKMFPTLLLAEKPETIRFILSTLPDMEKNPEDAGLLCQIKSLITAGFSVHLLALKKQKTDLLERFLDFGSKLSWEEAPQDRDLSLLKLLENSDLTWMIGREALQTILDFWQHHLGEIHALSPCLLDLRFETDLSLWDKAVFSEIEKNPLIDIVALKKGMAFPILDSFPELEQMILSLPQKQGEAADPLEIEKLRFIFDHSRQEILEKALEVFEQALPVFPIKCRQAPIAGSPDTKNGKAVIESIRMAVQWCQEGKVSGMITAPISKDILAKGGFSFPGHTEYLAHLCGVSGEETMMLACPELKVVLATVHVSIQQVLKNLTQERIIETGRRTDKALRQDFGLENPHIAVAGLNPHAGENGRMGTEENDFIAPAIAALRAEGINATGPYPPDTLFTKQMREKYDAVLCMYHDQGLIPLKTLAMERGVNITLGLPIVRTSPDHGTAFDIACDLGNLSDSVASEESLRWALIEAEKIATIRQKMKESGL
ncbi:pyridoxal phosphate biosynthetic protein [Lasius niger]|uniref:Pyridoxal phosphate biosynthetic protein n=1 Tax=Lasius niger TaxID=67767 RepID=A0A0J7KEX9_LASNI|nr:pyridoxal phosphate biosynthetic protein [Lasius niger]